MNPTESNDLDLLDLLLAEDEVEDAPPSPTAHSGATQRIPRRREPGDVPLSYAQRRMWVLQDLDPDSPAYNIPAVFRLQGSLHQRSLAGALGHLVERHESLRTTYHMVAGHAVQRIDPWRPLHPPTVDLSALDPDTAERLGRTWALEAPPLPS